MPDAPPATCHTVVSIAAPQYRGEILAALGIITDEIIAVTPAEVSAEKVSAVLSVKSVGIA